jgi:ribosomal protein S18 acetylase RimI-like enzyme
MLVRRIRRSDTPDVCRLVIATFKEFVAGDFTKNGIRQFIEDQTIEKQLNRLQTMDVFVALDVDKIVGMIEGNGRDKITRLFIDKNYHRKGVGRQLTKKIEDIYKAMEVKKLRVFSSLYAVEFYRKMGFKKSTGVMKREGFVYQPMVKSLYAKPGFNLHGKNK